MPSADPLTRLRDTNVYFPSSIPAGIIAFMVHPPIFEPVWPVRLGKILKKHPLTICPFKMPPASLITLLPTMRLKQKTINLLYLEKTQTLDSQRLLPDQILV